MKKLMVFLLPVLLFWTTSFAQLINDNDAGLPVRISEIKIARQQDAIVLNWKVVCQLPYARFLVERSNNSIDFSPLYSFNADRVRCQSPFDYTDKTAVGDVYYRIRVGDIDGKYSSERILHITAQTLLHTRLDVLNPMLGQSIKFIVTANENGKLDLNLIDMSGNILDRTNIPIAKGVSNASWSIPGVPDGNYFIKYTTKSGTSGVARIMKY